MGLLTFEDLLHVFFGKDRAAGVGGISNDKAGCPLIDQAFQVLKVNLPRLFWLQINLFHIYKAGILDFEYISKDEFIQRQKLSYQQVVEFNLDAC